MNTKNTFSSLLLATALVAGFGATAARADVDPAAAHPAGAADSTVGQGLLGQVYGNLTYSYINLDATSRHGDDYHFELNQPISFGLDGFLSYDFVDFDGGHQHIALAGVRPFSTRFNWGKPFVEAAAGYAWTSGDDSFIWQVGTGVEFQVTPQATVTPYIQYRGTPDLAHEDTWNFGVNGNYWVNSQWALTAGAKVDDDHNATFTIGTNFRY